MERQKGYFHGYTPIASGNQTYLERPRINRLLEKATQKPVVSIIAGAGYGKTCAVYGFARASYARIAWIQISERDNLGERFWENFVSAISIINADTAEELRRSEFPASEQQFKRLLNNSRQGVIPNEKYLFVYDDVHLINEPAVLDFLEHCINSPFPNITSVLISRTEPPLNMEKLASRKILARISEKELRFSRDEMISYFRLKNLSPSPRLSSMIYQETEGWAFAIHLAGLSLRNSSGTAYVPGALRYNVFKLIESEIMSALSVELQHFLIKLSLVENLNPDLVREISNDGSSSTGPELIKEMEELASFIRFDSYLNSYNIHHLFLDYLRERQNELGEEEKKEVWTKTALWCAANNRKMDAIISYEKIMEYNGIAGIVDSFPLILSRQSARFILDILTRAPENIYQDFPKTIAIRSRALASLDLFDQSREETLELLPRLLALPESPKKHQILLASYFNLGTIGIIQSIDTKKYDFIDFFKKAAEEARMSGHVTEAPLNGLILSSYVCRVTAPASKKDIDDYIEMLGEIIPYTAEAMGGCRYGLYELARGEFAFFRGELEESEKLLSQSLTKAREKQQFEIENRALFYLLRIYLNRGNTKKIDAILKQLRAELDEPLFPNRHSYYDIASGWYYLETGRNDQLAPWLKNDYEESELHLGAQGLEKLVKARYFFSENRYPAALAVIESRINAEPLLFGDIEMKVLEAACRYGQSEREAALRALEEAYNLAEPAGLFMPFAELGKDMRTLLETAIKDAAGDRIGAFPRSWLEETRRRAFVYAKKIYPQKKRTWNDPLSQRERAVLTGLSQGLTRQEIAGAASISPNTVKSVTRSIYIKLGALNRADAVRIAAERGIL